MKKPPTAVASHDDKVKMNPPVTEFAKIGSPLNIIRLPTFKWRPVEVYLRIESGNHNVIPDICT